MRFDLVTFALGIVAGVAAWKLGLLSKIGIG